MPPHPKVSSVTQVDANVKGPACNAFKGFHWHRIEMIIHFHIFFSLDKVTKSNLSVINK